MAREGSFTVELVHADTYVSFKEHVGSGGKVYAEVEPGMEYFIQIKVDDPDKKAFRSGFKVDGEDLGYIADSTGGNGDSLFGLWARQDNKDTMTALRFAMPQARPKRDGEEPSFGSVKVTFVEIFLKEGTTEVVDHVNSWVGGKKPVGAAISERHDKAVISGEGWRSISNQHSGEPRKKYDAGKTVATIELHYCTAFGLISAGVLPKPSAWELRREQAKKALSSSMTRCLAVEPESIVLTHENNKVGQKEVRADFFDLVEADVSDDEEDEEHELAENTQYRTL